MRTLAVLLALALATSLGGCRKQPDSPPAPRNAGQDPVKLSEELLARTRQIADILKSVNDEPSAQAAASKIRGMRAEMVKLAGEFKDLRRPTSQQALRMSAARTELAAINARIESEKKRLEDDPKLRVARDAAEDLDKAMQEASKNED